MAPPFTALVTFVILPLPWFFLQNGIEALAIPPLPELALTNLLFACVVMLIACVMPQWLALGFEVDWYKFLTLNLDSEDGQKIAGAACAFLVWGFLGMGLLAALTFDGTGASL